MNPVGSDIEKRWKTISAPASLEALSPFGLTADGLQDWRGFKLEGAIFGKTLSNLDLTLSKMGTTSQLGGRLIVERTKFDGCRYATSINASFEDCSFQESNLRGSTIVGKFINCAFRRSRLGRCRFASVKFLSCDFSGADFTLASFFDCHFENCLFSEVKVENASFAGSRFENCEISNTDFSKAILERVSGLP